LTSCHRKGETTAVTQDYTIPIKVQVIGYTGNIMEPFISRDGTTLLFNNLNAAPENTNLHWATRINDSSFQYQGEISGINTSDLEGVASLDRNGILYFVSTRNYPTTLSTIYQCNFANGVASNVQLVRGISKLQPGWVNFDVEVSADGNDLYFVDAKFDQSGNPSSADLVVAQKVADSFKRSSNSSDLMKNINTDALEYAACISEDELEFYFTRVTLPINANSIPEVFVSKRKTKADPFEQPMKIGSITGFAEAATIAPDQRTIYFHRKENNIFQLYMIRKK
jgi:hypothetical protein